LMKAAHRALLPFCQLALASVFTMDRYLSHATGAARRKAPWPAGDQRKEAEPHAVNERGGADDERPHHHSPQMLKK
jgi:hypothetical protein